MDLGAFLKIVLLTLALTIVGACKPRMSSTMSDIGRSATKSETEVLPWFCPDGDKECLRTPWGRTNQRLKKYLADALGGSDYAVYFSQYSRPNDDTRAAANPVAAIASIRKVPEKDLLQTVLKQDQDNAYIDRAGCVKAAVELMQHDTAAYEVAAATFAIAAAEGSNGRFKVAITNALESTTKELLTAASTGPFNLQAEISGRKIGGVRYQVDPTSYQVNTINHSTIAFELESGQHRGQFWIDGGRRWIVCKTQFNLPLDDSTIISCERFKFPLMYHIRTNTRVPVDQFQGKYIRWLKPDLSEPHNCKGLETHADTDELSPDSKLAYLLRQIKVDGKPTCLACHAMGNDPGFPGLFCGSKNPKEAFDPYGRPKEVVEIGLPMAAYFNTLDENTIPKWDQRDIWPENEIELMKKDFDRLIAAYCNSEAIEVPRRDSVNPVQRTNARDVLTAFLKSIGGPTWEPHKDICRPSQRR
jgi:hypothetical protein